MKKFIYDFVKEEDGLGTVEIVIIIAILVGIAFIFRDQIRSLVDQIFDKIFKDAGGATNVDDVGEKKLGG